MGLSRVGNDKGVLGTAVEVLAELVAQVGVGVAVADNLDGLAAAYGAVVGGDDDAVVGLCQCLEELAHHSVAEPRQGDAAVCGLVVGQLTHHLRLSAGMGEDVDEVDDDDVEVIVLQVLELTHQLLRPRAVDNLVVGEGLLAPVALQLGLNERRLIDVLALFLVFIDPQIWEHLGYLRRHQAREDGVAGILRGGGQNGTVKALVDVEHVADFLGQGAPLVVAEVVDDNEEDLLTAVEGREDDIGHDAVGHQGSVVGVFCHPLQVVLLDELCKVGVGLFLLHGEHLGHIAAGAGYLQFPTYEALIYFLPVVEGAAVLYLQRDVLE